jgi:hypothetical protein
VIKRRQDIWGKLTLEQQAGFNSPYIRYEAHNFYFTHTSAQWLSVTKALLIYHCGIPFVHLFELAASGAAVTIDLQPAAAAAAAATRRRIDNHERPTYSRT